MVSKFWHICLYDCAHRCERHLLFVSVLSVDRKLSVNRKWFVRQWNLLSVIRNYIADCVKVWVWVINNNTENTMLDARPASSETCQMMKSTLNQKPRLFTFIFVLLRPLKCFLFGSIRVVVVSQSGLENNSLQYCSIVMALLNYLFQHSQPKQLEIPGFSVSFPAVVVWESRNMVERSKVRHVEGVRDTPPQKPQWPSLIVLHNSASSLYCL